MLKKFYHKYHFYEFRRNPLLWIYAAYLTIRYIDKYNYFPAIKFNSFVRIRFNKSNTSIIQVNNRLIFEAFLGSERHSVITTLNQASIIVENDFALGGGIRIFVCDNALLKLKGKRSETASGITADSTIMVREYLELGYDCLIAWDTFITDSDWHTVQDKQHTEKTIIGDHIWIGVGVKILKGANIAENSIVTTNSVILKGKYPKQVMLSGNPGKVVKENIPNWIR